MTTDAEYRALAEMLDKATSAAGPQAVYAEIGAETCDAAASAILALLEERDRWKTVAVQFAEPFWCGSDCPCHNSDETPVSGILDAFPECWRSKDETRTTLAESRLAKAVEALRQVSMACGLYGEDLSFGDMKTVHRIQERARTVLSELEKSE